MGQKHKNIREIRTPSPPRDILNNPRSMRARMTQSDGAICSKNRKLVPYHRDSPNTRNSARWRGEGLGGGGGLEALFIIQRVKVRVSFHRCKQNLFRTVIRRFSLGCHFDLLHCRDLKPGCIFCSCFKGNVK